VHEIIRRHSRRAAVDNDPVVLNHLYVMAVKADGCSSSEGTSDQHLFLITD
jgi:hypothetical protein